MKKIKYILFLSIPLFSLWFCTSSSGVKDKPSIVSGQQKVFNPGNKNNVVLELFTSQGCSSCPPADRLLATYASKENVIALSFHVDYWNRLGWKDPYSSKEYTKRQYNYASALGANVYTPQIVINGEAEMVGSDVNKISATIKKILQQKTDAEISITSVNFENGKADIRFNVAGNVPNSVLNIALFEKRTTTDIKAGENSGVTLDGHNVVENFKTLDHVNNGSNSSSIDIPLNADKKNIAIAIYLQDKKSNKIYTASQINL